MLPAAAEKVIDAEAIGLWADTEFGEMLDQKRLNGAVITVVDENGIIFSRGYGYSDYHAKTPIDPGTTKVRVCSNSKTFVATALMQLVEQGHIDSLNDAANKYLRRIQLPRFNGKDITIRDLVTHRGGFEDSYFNAGTDKQVETPVSAEVIQRLLPEIVREPGTLSVYSNVNSALQGTIIEDISGLTLRGYLAQHIFQPLGMTNTVLNDGPPAPRGHARPYVIFSDGTSREVELVAKHPFYAPSGGVYSTAEDMSRFVQAHLNGANMNTGDMSGAILSPESFAVMHRVIARHHPVLTGIGVQFFIDDINGERVLSHGCGLPGFSSYLAFLPESHVGFFISVLSKGNRQDMFSAVKRFFSAGQDDNAKAMPPAYAGKFFYGFLKHFIGFPEPDTFLSLSREELAAYSGTYRLERRNHTTMLAALDLVVPKSATVTVADNEDGGLTINGKAPFFPVTEHVFRRGGHPSNKYVFDVDARGQPIRAMRLAAVPATRTGFWNNPVMMSKLTIGLVIICTLGAGMIFYPAKRRVERLTAGLSLAYPLSFIVILAALFVGFDGDNGIEEYVNTGNELRLFIIALACNAIAIIACTMTFLSARAWKRAYWGTGPWATCRRAAYSCLAMAGLGFIPILFVFNLLGFQLP